jgi:dTDP-4-dehydrorhamnose 3,5-epimerase-like enzyme
MQPYFFPYPGYFQLITAVDKFVLYDDRPDSPTCGEIQEFFISPENYMLVTVPLYLLLG